MSKTSAQQGYEEIDLIELVLKVYKFFKRRYKLMLVVSIISILLGWGASNLFLLPKYQSSMIISSRSLSASEITGLINTLDDLIKENNSEEFAKLTQIQEKGFKTIAAIKAMPNRDYQKNVEKDIRRDSTIAISLDLFDSKSWEMAQTGIVWYLENRPYVQKRTKIYKENQEKLLSQIQKEIKSIDSLKRIIEASLTAKNPVILSNSGGLHNEALKLYEAEKKVKENLAFSNDVTVIKEFTHLQKPKKSSIKDTIMLFGGIGIVFGLLIALVLELNRMIRKREENNL